MAVFQIASFEVGTEVETAERALHDFATHVRQHLPDVSWTAFRDPAVPTRYVSMLRADTPAAAARGTTALRAALVPLGVGDLTSPEYQLVTSSDLAPRRRRR